MASIVECIYCFEVLDAALTERKPLSLFQVEDSWDQYITGTSRDAIEEDEAEEAEQDDDQTAHENPLPTQLENAKPQPSKPSLLSVPNLLSTRHSSSPSNQSSSPSTPSMRSASPSPHTRNAASSSTSSQTSLSALQPDIPSLDPKPATHRQDTPMFVTWNTVSRHSNRKTLRGCIGTFEPQRIEHGLATYALTAALEDTRFPPITASELPQLEVGVTLLTDFETAPHPHAWDVGKHGIRISFLHQGRRLGATYLPDVPREQGWDRTETLVSLMRKAGWAGRAEDWSRVRDLQVVRYQGRKCAVGYGVWREWRSWVEEGRGLGL